MERILRRYLPGGVFTNVSTKASRNFSAVRGRNNRTTEVRFRLALVRAGISGWSVQPGNLPGNPDFVFARHKIVVFVDGCFWHGCPRCGHIPKTNSAFWRAKIQRNMARDRNNRRKLVKRKFRVTRIWEHQLQGDLNACITRIQKLLGQNQGQDKRNRASPFKPYH